MIATERPKLDFPMFLAFYNPFTKTAFKMAYKESAEIVETFEFRESYPTFNLLKHTTKAYVLDALFVHRFYARLLEGVQPEKTRMKVRIEGEVMKEGPLSDFYLPPNLDIEAPFEWPKSEAALIFPAIGCRGDKAFSKEVRGLMLPNDTRVTISVNLGHVVSPAKIEVGLVAAVYTTGFNESKQIEVLDDGKEKT